MGVFKNDVGRPTNKSIMIRNILKVAVLIIVAVGLVCGGYYLNDYQKKTDSKKTITTKDISNKELNINSEDVMKLYLPFSYFMHEASEEELYKKDKVTSNDLSYEYKNRLAFAHYYNVIKDHEKLYEGTYYNKTIEMDVDFLYSKTLQKYYVELFGKSEKYVPKTFSSFGLDSIVMYYDKSEDKYYDDIASGDYTGFRYGNEFYKAIKKNDTIELYEYVVVYNEDYEKNIQGVYNNINDAKSFKNAIKEVKYPDSSNQPNLQKYKDKEISYNGIHLDDLSDYKKEAAKYKLTFKLEDNNYVFKSIEKLK